MFKFVAGRCLDVSMQFFPPCETAWKVWWQGEVTRDGKLMQTNTPTLNQTPVDHTLGPISLFLLLQLKLRLQGLKLRTAHILDRHLQLYML